MKRIALCFMAAALVSCKPELQSILVFDEVVDFKTSETSLISDKVVNVEYIPLELTENSRFGRVNKVVVENGLVYIWGYFQPKAMAKREGCNLFHLQSCLGSSFVSCLLRVSS